MKNFNQKIAQWANWINNNIVGNPWTFIVCVVFVIAIYIALFFQGYTTWNVTTGLFSNTLESSFELITGVGAVVAVVALHKKHKAIEKKLDTNATKLDAIHKHLGIKS